MFDILSKAGVTADAVFSLDDDDLKEYGVPSQERKATVKKIETARNKLKGTNCVKISVLKSQHHTPATLVIG